MSAAVCDRISSHVSEIGLNINNFSGKTKYSNFIICSSLLSYVFFNSFVSGWERVLFFCVIEFLG